MIVSYTRLSFLIFTCSFFTLYAEGNVLDTNAKEMPDQLDSSEDPNHVNLEETPDDSGFSENPNDSNLSENPDNTSSSSEIMTDDMDFPEELSCVDSVQSTCCIYERFWLEGKVGYFRPSSSKFRRIYSGGATYVVEMSVRTYERLFSWLSIGLFPKSGSSIGENSPTKLYLVPVGIGLKYVIPFDKHNNSIYFGGGVLPAYVKMHDRSSFVIPKISKWGTGGVAKIGVLLRLPYSLLLDFFADYSFLKINFSNTDDGKVLRNRGDFGGLSVGVGLGYRF